jgi:hypothetical protein
VCYCTIDYCKFSPSKVQYYVQVDVVSLVHHIWTVLVLYLHTYVGFHGQRNSGDQPLPTFPLQVECLSDVCTADGLTTDPGLEAKSPKVFSQSTIKWPRQGLPGPRSWAVWRRFLVPYTRDSTNNRLRQTLGPWVRPVLRNWPAYYDSSSQMLYQMIPPHATATLGTSSTSWPYHPAGIECTRRFVAVSKNVASFQDSRPPPNAVPATVLLDTPTL